MSEEEELTERPKPKFKAKRPNSSTLTKHGIDFFCKAEKRIKEEIKSKPKPITSLVVESCGPILIDSDDDSTVRNPPMNAILLSSDEEPWNDTLGPENAHLLQELKHQMNQQSARVGLSLEPIKSFANTTTEVELEEELIELRNSALPVSVNTFKITMRVVAKDIKRKDIALRVRSTGLFKNVFDKVIEQVGSEVVLAFKGVRLFPSSTPAALGMKDGEYLEMWTLDGWQQAQKARECQSESESESELLLEPTVEPEEDGLFLTLRSRKEDYRLKVKPDSMVGAIIQQYKKKFSLENVKIALEFEGDKLEENCTVDELELEDGDMVTVLFL